MKHLQKLSYIALGAVMALALNLTVPTLAAGTENVVKQLTAYFTSGGKPITIYVDGEKVNITQKDSDGNVVQPFVSNGATYLPVKTVAEAFGKTAEWDGATASVYIGKRPGVAQYMTDVCPAYQTSSQSFYKEYSALKSGGADSVTLGGVKYLNGFTLQGGGTWATYNLNGQYSSFLGVLCHVDGKSNDTQDVDGLKVLQVFCDGVLKQEFKVSSDMAAQNISIDVTGVNQLKINLGSGKLMGGNVFYGIGDPILK